MTATASQIYPKQVAPVVTQLIFSISYAACGHIMVEHRCERKTPAYLSRVWRIRTVHEKSLTERQNTPFALFDHVLISCGLLTNAIPPHITMGSNLKIGIPLDPVANEQRLRNVGRVPYSAFNVSHVEEKDVGTFIYCCALGYYRGSFCCSRVGCRCTDCY